MVHGYTIMTIAARIVLFLGLATSLTVAQDVKLQIVPMGETHTRALHTSIVFTCSVTGVTPEIEPNLEWYDEENREIIDQTGRMYIENDGPQELKMYITAINTNDAGKYTCKGTVEGNRVQQEVYLLLFKDITFEHAPTPQNPKIYSDAVIACRVSGQPVPTISWRYRGKKIVTGGRYVYQTEGLMIRNISESDNGHYTCRAEVAADGRLKETTIVVTVHIPPEMTKELGQQEGIEDHQVSLTCQAKGKPAPKYEFYRLQNGVEIPVQPRERIEIDRDAGAIHFRPLKEADKGDYLCMAKNDVGEARSKGYLKVIVPPRIIDLKNKTQLEGNTEKLLCISRGFPAPHMTFRKAGTSREYQEGENEGGRIKVTRVADNGLEMIVKNLSPKDTSNYTCRATNDGGEHAQNGTIVVEYKPKFDPDHNKVVYSWPGKTKNMSCHAGGEPEPVVDWYLNDLDRPLRDNETYKVFKMGRNSELQVKVRDVDQGWIYAQYLCKAYNKHGEGSILIELRKATVPGKPRSADVREESPTMVVLSIQPPEVDGGIPIYGYRIEYESRSQDFKLGEGIRIENLRPSTNYIFRIRAKNEVGVGNYLEYTHTTEAIRSPYPIVITSDPEGKYPYNYVLRWEKPRTGGLPIREYEFKYRQVKVKDNSWIKEKPLEDWTRLDVRDDPIRPMLFYTLEVLQPNAFYEVQVRAHNDIGYSVPNPGFVFSTADGKARETSPPISGNTVTSSVGEDGKPRTPGPVVGNAATRHAGTLLAIFAVLRILL